MSCEKYQWMIHSVGKKIKAQRGKEKGKEKEHGSKQKGSIHKAHKKDSILHGTSTHSTLDYTQVHAEQNTNQTVTDKSESLETDFNIMVNLHLRLFGSAV